MHPAPVQPLIKSEDVNIVTNLWKMLFCCEARGEQMEMENRIRKCESTVETKKKKTLEEYLSEFQLPQRDEEQKFAEDHSLRIKREKKQVGGEHTILRHVEKLNGNDSSLVQSGYALPGGALPDRPLSARSMGSREHTTCTYSGFGGLRDGAWNTEESPRTSDYTVGLGDQGVSSPTSTDRPLTLFSMVKRSNQSAEPKDDAKPSASSFLQSYAPKSRRAGHAPLYNSAGTARGSHTTESTLGRVGGVRRGPWSDPATPAAVLGYGSIFRHLETSNQAESYKMKPEQVKPGEDPLSTPISRINALSSTDPLIKRLQELRLRSAERTSSSAATTSHEETLSEVYSSVQRIQHRAHSVRGSQQRSHSLRDSKPPSSFIQMDPSPLLTDYHAEDKDESDLLALIQRLCYCCIPTSPKQNDIPSLANTDLTKEQFCEIIADEALCDNADQQYITIQQI